MKEKLKIFFENAKTKLKQNPHIAFVSVLAVLVIFSGVATMVAKEIRSQRALEAARAARQAAPAQQPAQQAQQAAQQQPAQQQQAPPPLLLWKGVPLVLAGPVKATAPETAAALDGTVLAEPLVLAPPDPQALRQQKDIRASVTFPVGGKHSGVSFRFAQQGITGDASLFAYCSIVQFVADGKVLKEWKITKDSYLARPEDVLLNLAGVQQLDIRIATQGRQEKKGSYVETVDQYGPYFPIVLAGLTFY